MALCGALGSCSDGSGGAIRGAGRGMIRCPERISDQSERGIGQTSVAIVARSVAMPSPFSDEVTMISG